MEVIRSTPTRDTLTEFFVCPKCHAKNPPDSQSCQSCGILFSRFYAQVEDRLETDFRLAGYQPLIELWQTVLSNYEDPAAHRLFVETCAGRDALEFAAYRYRVLDNVINDDIAKSQLKQIAALAQAPFETGRDADASFTMPRYHLWFFVLGGLFLGIGLLGGHAFRPLGLSAAIFLGGLWAFRAASDYKY